MASIRCPDCDHKEKIPADYDRATIRCSECGTKIPLDDEDDEPEPPIKKKKKKPGKSFWTPWVEAANKQSTAVKVIVGLGILSMLLACIPFPPLMLIPVVYGLLLILLSGLLFLLVVFNDSGLELLMCVFLPFYSLYYLITHWEETKAVLYLELFGMAVCAGFLCGLPGNALIHGTNPVFMARGGNNPPPPNFNQPPNIPPPNVNQPPNVNPKPEPPPPAKVTGDPVMDQLLADLHSKELLTQNAAVRSLVGMAPNQHRPAVMKKLHEELKGELSMRRRALEVMKVWATRDDTLLLLPYLNDPDVRTKHLTIQVLAEVKDERAAEPLARCLLAVPTRLQAEQALKKFGSAAEPALIKLLGEKNISTQLSVLNLLADLGTQRSIPSLQALANGPLGVVSSRAQSAIKSIQARSK